MEKVNLKKLCIRQIKDVESVIANFLMLDVLSGALGLDNEQKNTRKIVSFFRSVSYSISASAKLDENEMLAVLRQYVVTKESEPFATVFNSLKESYILANLSAHKDIVDQCSATKYEDYKKLKFIFLDLGAVSHQNLFEFSLCTMAILERSLSQISFSQRIIYIILPHYFDIFDKTVSIYPLLEELEGYDTEEAKEDFVIHLKNLKDMYSKLEKCYEKTMSDVRGLKENSNYIDENGYLDMDKLYDDINKVN